MVENTMTNKKQIMNKVTLLKGDCLEKLKELEDNSVDAVVTDPPYGLEFMGKEWDSFKTGRIAKYKEGGSLDIDAIQSRKGKGGAGPSYTKRAAKRCRTCGKQEWSGSPCKCETPDFEIDNSTQYTFQEFSEAWAKECYRVLKPGGHLLAFAGSRMYHRLAVGVEDAGFEIRDQIMWIYGSGFPKSHNIGKAIDKIQGNEREVVGDNPNHRESDALFELGFQGGKGDGKITKGNSPYEGWGTALKPAHEPIVMARKPFKGNVANNVLEWGTGGINVDGCRIGNEVRTTPIHSTDVKEDNTLFGLHPTIQHHREETTLGRFPANIIFECTCDTTHTKPAPKSGHWPKGKTKGFGEFGGGESSYEGVGPKEEGDMVIHTDPNCPCYILDKQSGTTKSSGGIRKKDTETQPTSYDINHSKGTSSNAYAGEVGGASRFFYCPKTSKKDRNEGCDALENVIGDHNNIASKRLKCDTCGKWAISTDHCKCENPNWIQPETKNNHPTVKPTDLMGYLIRLITPKGGLVLDPFMGSGSTGKAAVREGMSFIGIEREDEYMEIAKSRIEHEQKKNKHQDFFNI